MAPADGGSGSARLARGRRTIGVLVAAVLVGASLAVLPVRSQPAAAAGCVSGAPLLVPIIASGSPSGSFQWSNSSCGQVSGSWTSYAGGGSFSYTGQVTGTWTLSSGGGSFGYGCPYCDRVSGTWSTTSDGGSLDYSCIACGHVIGSWTSFINRGGTFHYGCSGCDPATGTWTSNTFGGSITMLCSSCDVTSGSWTWSLSATPTPAPTPSPSPSAPCVTFTGPGIAPPQGLATGIDGLHAAWYGQSGYPSLCPGDRTTVTVAYLNTGSIGWVLGRPGQTAYLGTWYPDPGQDKPSVLGGDGTRGSPSTGWAVYDRPAVQSATYVGPGQVAWFQFVIQAPTTPGTYRLAVRPVIEGTQWLEDYGVFVSATVRSTTAP